MLFNPNIFDTENEGLLAHPTIVEVSVVVHNLNTWKCPGPDGLNGEFYEKSWGTITNDVTALTQSLFPREIPVSLIK